MKENYKSLEVRSFRELADKDFEQIEPLIDHLLPGVGVFLFCGSSKIGKSWLALDIGLHVCNGTPLWNYDVARKDVLYLCLEDGERRLQDRMFNIADIYSVSFHYCTDAMTIDTDLIKQLDEQIKINPAIGMIIIDTLAAIRGEQTAINGNAYLGDYNIIRMLHEFAQKQGITILVVHHVRKMKSTDPFDDISGTNGLFGSADGAFIFRKDRPEDEVVKLYSRCRDMEDRVLTLRFDKATCKWELLDESSPIEDEFKTDPDLRKALNYINIHGEFYGTAQEFCNLIGASKKPQSLSGKLQNKKHYLEKQGIIFDKHKTNKGMVLNIVKISDVPYEIKNNPDGDSDDV